ncbi:YjbF family lipoprotein [Stenotrophomonas sp. MMGLT7]|uniref:YjbF family lipoprotein n=1 Tax=Stenotrophomonas sp. MMGLT7 TaxID=2901227 RepID=UPI001E651603|nr:YjbF family lipoprotein [Stenotrophomonas sp. MMGLT7]MCD7100378.1 YjbF family lipoprotein [Stenotrophomonas sp. MMGLT7]
MPDTTALRQHPRCFPARCMGLILAAGLALVATGCTTVSRSTSDAIRLLFQGRPDVTPTAEQVAALPYPQALIQAPDLSAVLVLGQIDDGRQVWYAGRNAVYYLQGNGLLAGSAGMGRTVAIRVEGEDPFLDLPSVQGPVAVQRRYDWMPGYRYGVPVTGSLRRTGAEDVTILGRTLHLARYEETLDGGGLSGSNTYWADPESGFIWKSRQYLAPGHAVEIVQLKPYRPAKS